MEYRRKLAFAALNLALGLGCVYSQSGFVIDAPFKATAGTQVAINGPLTVSNETADLGNVSLHLVGSAQTLSNGRGSSAALRDLVVDGGGNKTLSGVWEVNRSMTFNSGVIVFSGGGKIVFTKASAQVGDILVNDVGSYVNGPFYSKGTGNRFFPIGNNGGYKPAVLSNVSQDLEIGMQVLGQNSSLTFGSDILSILTAYHWLLIDPSNSLAGAGVALSSLNNGGYIDPNVGTIIMSGASTGSPGESLGGAVTGDFVEGSTPITTSHRVFTFAKIGSDQVKVKIHNVVTPYNDDVNDYLQIENISLFPTNKVRLLDRWGVQVREWSGFVNAENSDDPSHDLSDLSTGNYICILEYTDGTTVKKLSQMVTVINH